jgi:3-hydroxyacyl-CoA dehydrogenase
VNLIQKAIAFRARSTSCRCLLQARRAFCVNRVLVPYLYEAMFALQDGIPIEVIDEAALRFGMPWARELADVVASTCANTWATS